MNIIKKFILMIATLMIFISSSVFATTWNVTIQNNMTFYFLGIKLNKYANEKCWQAQGGTVILRQGESYTWNSNSNTNAAPGTCEYTYQRGFSLFVISGQNVWNGLANLTLNEDWGMVPDSFGGHHVFNKAWIAYDGGGATLTSVSYPSSDQIVNVGEIDAAISVSGDTVGDPAAGGEITATIKASDAHT